MASQVNSAKYLKKSQHLLLSIYSKKKEGTLSNSFYKAKVMMLKPKKPHTHTERPISLINIGSKMLNKMSAN